MVSGLTQTLVPFASTEWAHFGHPPPDRLATALSSARRGMTPAPARARFGDTFRRDSSGNAGCSTDGLSPPCR